MQASVTIEALTRYPVKGLSGEALEHVHLAPGQGFPFDRQFGFARPGSGFDPEDPKPLPKTKFYMLARDERLSGLTTRYDEAAGTLSVAHSGQNTELDLSSESGRQAASQYLKTFLGLPETQTPHLYEGTPHRFTDVSVDSAQMMNAVSIINRDSVDAFSQAIGSPVEPERFRGNILISGLEPFLELDLVGEDLVIGSVKLRVLKRTRRCAATQVNLATGQRDLDVPKLLHGQYGHMDMGIYAEVITGGDVSLGASVQLS